MNKSISALIIDQHPLIRHVVRGLIECKGGKVYETGEELESIKMASIYKPSIIVIDFVGYKNVQLNLIQKLMLMSPESKVLIYTSLTSIYYLKMCLGIGVRGYVYKKDDVINLDGAIDAVMSGYCCFPQLDLPVNA
ncbi:putative two-component response regulator [Yersinia frederiksenii]|uniref:Response regulator n=3 Tax=Yersinia frederiksenii TaxID=29484 RepID=A0ABR4VWU8_YERFR|nr:response regulator [Yersinia frederiksenii]ATM95779.1 DNA-binding response regulator [Yersinia frederiksenii]KGA44336.1 response regulator [Yersinia frederiksenii ATCC 33641]MDN0117718.1 response regulator transcription factor [Yersinia frederiksenii]CFR15190.1 putative two-component response regulator [Yersinia frederiksenii]CNC28738.1 putative two-component response regulator [Yersinia frederiksenii]